MVYNNIKKYAPHAGAVTSCALAVASEYVPSYYKPIIRGAAVLVGGLSVGSWASEKVDTMAKKVTATLENTNKTILTTGSDAVHAMGGNPLKPIELKEVSKADKAKMGDKNNAPIMDNNTKSTWDRITKWIGLENKIPFGKKQANYDCVYMYGPPGTGKTVFANALFGAVPDKYDLKLANITAGDLMERGAEKLNHLKKEVLTLINDTKDSTKPVCLGFFLDEVEGSLNKDRSMNAGVVNEYLTFINEVKDAAAHNKNVYILGALATNYDDQVDRASKRDGRVTDTLHVDYPSLDMKNKLLEYALNKTGYNETKKQSLLSAVNSNKSITEALQEENLVGASLVNAVEKTQKDMQINNNSDANAFITKLAENIVTATNTATQQREKDEEELEARKSLAIQLSGMREALKTIAKKTGDNEALEGIMKNMGEKFEALQKASAKDREKIIAQIAEFIKQVEKHSTNASDSATASKESATNASNSAENASRSALSACSSNNDLNNKIDAFKYVSNNMRTLEYIIQQSPKIIEAYNNWFTRTTR